MHVHTICARRFVSPLGKAIVRAGIVSLDAFRRVTTVLVPAVARSHVIGLVFIFEPDFRDGTRPPCRVANEDAILSLY